MTNQLNFLDNHRPVLNAGDYSLTLTQSISVKGSPYSASLDQPFQFKVSGPQYRLLPSDIATVFPPPDSVGDYVNVLPHVTLTRSTLPWERTAGAEGTPDGPPWLAILLIYETESSKVTQRVVKQSELEPKSREDATVLVVDADEAFLRACLPTKTDLPLLCHVREGGQEIAVVLCARVPHATEVNYAYLVSAEGCYSGTQFARKFTGVSGTARLPVLKSWRFTPGDPAKSLQQKLKGLSAGPLTAVRQSTVKSPPGVSLFSYHMRGGGTSAAFYRGPLAPCTVQAPVNKDLAELRSPDSLIRYEEGNGVFDVTYAAAWELGRLLALASGTFTRTLLQWKHEAKSKVLANEARENVPHIDFVANGPAPGPQGVPIEISSFIKKLKSLELVPVNYLLPDQDAVPPEAIRFFQIDSYWMQCLLEGAFGIGRSLVTDAAHEQEIRTAIGNNPVTSFSKLPVSGFLLRSEVVAGYPDLAVEATDKNNNAGTLSFPPRLLAPGLKVYAFDQLFGLVTLHPAPMEVHCERGKLRVQGDRLVLDKTSGAEIAAELMAEVTPVGISPGAAAK